MGAEAQRSQEKRERTDYAAQTYSSAEALHTIATARAFLAAVDALFPPD